MHALYMCIVVFLRIIRGARRQEELLGSRKLSGMCRFLAQAEFKLGSSRTVVFDSYVFECMSCVKRPVWFAMKLCEVVVMKQVALARLSSVAAQPAARTLVVIRV